MKAQKRKPEKQRSAPKPPLKNSSIVLIAAICLALFCHWVFMATYPINVGQSDNVTYLAMLINGSSHLMQASGYPAIIYYLRFSPFLILPQPDIPSRQISDIKPAWFDTLQLMQFVLHLAVFGASVFLCRKVFGDVAAVILTLGWGCNALFISNVDATAPEWLEADFLILVVLMHAFARRLTVAKKALIYSSAAVLFGVAYVVKFNAILFGLTLAGFLLFDKATWRFKALQAVASAVLYLIVTNWFAQTYHLRNTGTTTLTFDHAWVMTASLPEDYVIKSPENLGLNSLRWSVLVRVTPLDYFRAGVVENIKYGPVPEEQKTYDQRWDQVFKMSRSDLLTYLEQHPVPKDFRQWPSAVPLYYYYGLAKADALGQKVYLESLLSHPGFHFQKLWRAHLKFLTDGLKDIKVFPTFKDTMGFTILPPEPNAGFFTQSRIVPKAGVVPYFEQYYNPREKAWYTGIKIAQVIDTATSTTTVYLFLNVVALAGLFMLKTAFDRITALSILLGILVFISASGMLLGLRQKELITITPLYFLLLSIVLPVVVASLMTMIRARSGEQQSNSKKA